MTLTSAKDAADFLGQTYSVDSQVVIDMNEDIVELAWDRDKPPFLVLALVAGSPLRGEMSDEDVVNLIDYYTNRNRIRREQEESWDAMHRRFRQRRLVRRVHDVFRSIA